MYFSFFFAFCSSVWWEYNPEEYKEMEEQSLIRPIFVVCTSPTCPHCKGLPQLLRQFSDMLGEKAKVVFSALNCVNNELCNKIGVKGVPQFVLIRGTDPKYWVQTYERGFTGWSRFLSDQTKVTLTEVVDELQFEQLILKTSEGGTTFHLTIPTNNNNAMKTYKGAASFYGLMGCTFTYSTRGNELILASYHSSSCNITKKVTESEILPFIDGHKFSAYHHFNLAEITEMMERKRHFFVAMTDDPLPFGERDILDTYSQKYCGRIIFGWADRNTDHSILQLTGRTTDTEPFFFVINPSKKCLTINSLLGEENSVDEFINTSILGEKCSKMPKIKTGGKKIFSRHSGLIILGVIGFLFLCYFVYHFFYEGYNKIE